MIQKKIIFGLFILCTLGACAAPTAMIGPAYTLTSSGNVFQAGLSYGSSELVTAYTGKTPIENLEEFTNNNLLKKKNIHKQTLESQEFQQLVKNRILKTKEIIELSNQ
tara:strand:+ start:111 stop:434 length:324 start_codon:yes stop_codon:yes gene_type:complete